MQVKQYFHGPLIFHNNPPSTVRPRHRNDRVASQIVRDSAGREHLLLNFFIQGQVPGTPLAESDSRFEAAVEWTKRSGAQIADMSFEEIVDGAKRYGEDVWGSCKRLFKFLSGDQLPSTRPPPPPPPEVKEGKTEGGWRAGFVGMFAGLRGSSREVTNSSEDSPDGQAYTDGEVHADLIMVSGLARARRTAADGEPLE